MKVLNIFIVVFFAAGLVTYATSPLSEVYLLMDEERYSEAAKVLSLFLEQGDEASSEISNEIVVNGEVFTRSRLYGLRANCRYRLGNYKEALSDYKQECLLGNEPEALFWIARCMYEEGMYEEAIQNLNRYLKTSTLNRRDQFLGRYYIALSWLGKGELDEGILHLEEIKKDFPERKSSAQNIINQVVEEKKRRKEKQLHSSTNNLDHAE